MDLLALSKKKLTYDFADHNRKIVPQLWTKNLTAGEDWLYGFMNRFKELSLRRPEAISLSHTTSFNKANVAELIILILMTSIMLMRQVVVLYKKLGI